MLSLTHRQYYALMGILYILLVLFGEKRVMVQPVGKSAFARGSFAKGIHKSLRWFRLPRHQQHKLRVY